MTGWREAKIRSEATWAQVRAGWEAGETGASLARRYDVGLANLWRRRASETWRRREREDPTPEPIEGWDRFAENARTAFETRLEEERLLAAELVVAMRGERLEQAPIWHLGFLLRWRADNLGPEVAARDREHLKDKPWVAEFWDASGRLRRQAALDRVLMAHERAAWREEVGLPDGVAEHCP